MATTGKRGLILCPGPSLAAALPRLRVGDFGAFDVSAVVNRAAKEWPADLWSILDAESFDDVEPIGRPTIVIGERGVRKLLRKHPKARTEFGVVVRESLAETPPIETRWYRWSALVAIVAAWNRGAREFWVFGADLAGRNDFDGVRLKRQHRDERRWKRERLAWQRLAAWMKAHGGELRRIVEKRTTTETAGTIERSSAADNRRDRPELPRIRRALQRKKART